jgi:PAS domain-containing protein
VRRTLNFVVMAVLAQFLLLRVAAMVRDGFTWTHGIWAHVYLIGLAIALVWELHGRKAAAEREAGEIAKGQANRKLELISLVLLLDRAIGNAGEVERKVDGQRFVLTISDRPYVKDREGEANGAATVALAEAIRRHEAWCAVDAVGPIADKDAAYDTIGRLLADLVTDAGILAIFCPEDGRMVAWEPAMAETLRGGNPRAVFVRARMAVG